MEAEDTFITLDVDPQWIYSLRLDSLAREVAARMLAHGWVKRGKSFDTAEQRARETLGLLIEMGLPEICGYAWNSTTQQLAHPGLIQRAVEQSDNETSS